MRLTIMFPKSGCYALKDLSEKRILKDMFTKYLTYVKLANCQVEYLLEDSLARDMLIDAGISNARVVSCVTPADINFLKQYREVEDLEDYIFDSYSGVEHRTYDAERKYSVPLSALKEGKAAYFKKRVQNFRKSYSYSVNKYIAECTNVLQFRTGNSMDRGCAVSTTSKLGDGRLCVEVNVYNKISHIYYGGVFMQEEALPAILSL